MQVCPPHPPLTGDSFVPCRATYPDLAAGKPAEGAFYLLVRRESFFAAAEVERKVAVARRVELMKTIPILRDFGIYIYICIHMHMHTYTYIYMCVCVRIHTYTH